MSNEQSQQVMKKSKVKTNHQRSAYTKSFAELLQLKEK